MFPNETTKLSLYHDAGGKKSACLCRQIGLWSRNCHKANAPNQAEVITSLEILEGCTAILIDDLADTGGTLTKAAKATIDLSN